MCSCDKLIEIKFQLQRNFILYRLGPFNYINSKIIWFNPVVMVSRNPITRDMLRMLVGGNEFLIYGVHTEPRVQCNVTHNKHIRSVDVYCDSTVESERMEFRINSNT